MRTTTLFVAVMVLAACPRRGDRTEPGKTEPQPEKKTKTSRQDPAALEVPIMKDTVKLDYSERLLKELRAALKARPEKSTGTVKKIATSAWRPEDRRTLTLDLSTQVLKLDIPEDRGYGDREGKAEPDLKSSFYDLGRPGGFVPASMLGHKAKVFDDGLYAAVELAAEQGAGSHPGRKALLTKLTAALSGASGAVLPAGAVVAASAKLRGLDVKLAGELAAAAEKERKAFLGDPKRSKPIGFYTWSEELVRIFQGDRMLQAELKPGPAAALARLIGGDKQLLAAYKATVELAARLTNPLARPDLGRLAAGEKADEGQRYAVVPPSVSHETELIKKLYGNRPIPDGFNLADELISRIRAGKLSLAPRPESGWYDHQTYALEPLVIPEKMPEARRLELTEAYRRELVGLFKALLALTRETHIKQLEVPAAGAGMPSLIVAPRLSVEPLAAHYLRRARAYRFVRGVLERAFGKQALGKLRRMTPGGPMNVTLDEELSMMQGLFHGAYLTACDEVGIEPEADKTLAGGGHRQLFRTWAKTYATDPDLQADIRVMVPIFYDLQRRKMKVWVVLGVAEKKLKVTFAKRPTVKSLVDASGKPADPKDITWDDATYKLAYFVTAERYVTKLLDRKELRALCDRHRKASVILEHLK
jgi:hypothetical protein